MIPSAIAMVDIKLHFLNVRKAAAVRVLERRAKCFAWGWSQCIRKLTSPGRVLKALWNTGSAANLPFLFGSGSKIVLNLI